MAAVTKSSQDIIDEFWRSSISLANLSKASAVLPPNVYTQHVGRQAPKGSIAAESVDASYEVAKEDCEKKVAQIVKECMMVNQKYTDPYFGLEDRSHCLYTLSARRRSSGPPRPAGTGYDVTTDAGRAGHLLMFNTSPPDSPGKINPPSVKRIGDIFDDPHFFVDGASARDIRQGREGDCWFLSALSALCSLKPNQHLINKICVARNQDVGVYGFVMYRDGEWTSVIIDDKLYLREPDYEFTDKQTRSTWEENRIRVNSAEEYRKEFQSNSRSLFYAQSSDPNETWVPLVEKAFAKAHGDYGSISGGSVGEGVEDLTGGVSTTIIPTDILDKNKFWNEGLLKVGEEFLFGCGTAWWDDPMNQGRDGLYGGHAYSILRAVNYGKERLVLMKNPWGQHEWNGPWSDGSREWTPESIRALGHTFGNDGLFWIRYEDLLRKYDTIWRTRLFSSEWKVTQQWTNMSIPWAGEYQDTKFQVTISRDSPTVFVLSKLDERYFKGLIGQYDFVLSFRIHKAGEDEYIMRTFGSDEANRSVNCEVTLEAGTYEVRVKISAIKDDDADKVEDVVKDNWLERRDKLLQVGQAYDLAHAKAQTVDEEKPNENIAPAAKIAAPPEVIHPDDAKTNVAKTDKKDAATTELPKAEATMKNPIDTEIIVESGEPVDGKGEGQYEDGCESVYASEYGSYVDCRPDKRDERRDLGGREGKDGDDKPDDPWSAVAVVSLRVYCREGDASIKIIRPTPPVVARQKVPAKLDVDDPARDAAKGEVLKKEEKKKKEAEEGFEEGGEKKRNRGEETNVSEKEEKKEDEKEEKKEEKTEKKEEKTEEKKEEQEGEKEEIQEEGNDMTKEREEEEGKDEKNEPEEKKVEDKKNGNGDSDGYVDVKTDGHSDS